MQYNLLEEVLLRSYIFYRSELFQNQFLVGCFSGGGMSPLNVALLLIAFFLAFDLRRFCVVIRRIFYALHLFSYLNYWERASILPLECSVLNKGKTGTICITSLVWRGPWLGIEPGTSPTRSQHYTTRLSRRRILTRMKTIRFSVNP